MPVVGKSAIGSLGESETDCGLSRVEFVIGLIILAKRGVVQIRREKRHQFVPEEPQNEKADLMLFRTKSAFVGRLTGKFD